MDAPASDPASSPGEPAEALDALVIGAGPAGLMAAEALAAAGRRVVVAEAKPSPARKLLMAGKSGLNLTKVEPDDAFRAAYAEAAPRLRPMLDAFGPAALGDWARGLGQELFVGSTGRVFPVVMKASPLLRAWLARLAAAEVTIRAGWRWTGWRGGRNVPGPATPRFAAPAEAEFSALVQGVGMGSPGERKVPGSPAGWTFAFATPAGPRLLAPRVAVLALGGASWARLGSDGAWAPWLAARGVPVRAFEPANVGLAVAWSPHMERRFGAPVKGVALVAGEVRSRGEWVISARGIEGGGVYRISRAVREGAAPTLDLLPDRTLAEVAAALGRPRGKATVAAHLRRALRLSPVALALLQEWGRPLPDGPALARLVKAVPVRHSGLRPLDEAISTAGGVAWAGVDERLMLRALPGVFAAGEMLDWEAPTGGYLLTAAFATGAWAGRHAAEF